MDLYVYGISQAWPEKQKNTTVNNRHYDVQGKHCYGEIHISCVSDVFFFVSVCVCFSTCKTDDSRVFVGVCLFKMMQTLLMNLQQILFIK